MVNVVISCILNSSIIVLLLTIVIALVVISKNINKYIDKKIDKIESEISNIEKNNLLLDNENYLDMINYSDSLLKSIRELIASISKLKFKEFTDRYELSKITKEQVKQMVEDTAMDVKKSIDMQSIDYHHIIYSEDFLNEYIIETTIYVLKQFVEETVDDLL